MPLLAQPRSHTYPCLSFHNLSHFCPLRLSKAKSFTNGVKNQAQTQVPLKEGLTGFQNRHPYCKPAKPWAQFFTIRRQHLFTCLILWPWSTIPEESSSSSSGISNLTRHFISPAASNSINRKLVTITLSPQEVRPHKSNFQIYGLTYKPFLTHFDDLLPKHSRYFSTKCLRSTQSPSSHPKGRRNC